MPAFAGFRPAAFDWFAGLAADNTRAYFTATRAVHDADVRGAFAALLDELAGEFGGEAKVFRQQRDLRFDPGGLPYKTRTYGLLHSRPGTEAGLFAEVSAEGLYAGTGMYQPAKDQLERYRAAVADDTSGPALEAAVATAEAAGLTVEGWALKSAPRGYPRDHPRIALLRRKALIAGRRLPPTPAGIPRDAALAHVATTWRAAEPILAWLDIHVGPAEAVSRARR